MRCSLAPPQDLLALLLFVVVVVVVVGPLQTAIAICGQTQNLDLETTLWIRKIQEKIQEKLPFFQEKREEKRRREKKRSSVVMAQLNPNAASFSPVRGGGGAGAGPGPGATSTNSSERQQQQQQLVGFRVKSTYTSPQGVKGKGKGKKTAVGSNVANTSASAANEEDDASRTRGGRGAGAGRKRQNQRQKGGLNHLLNFNSGRTPTHARASEQNRRAHQNARRKQHVPIKYNKDLFVQAQFRFLVSDAVDVTGYLDSPDKMLDWEDVAVLESTSESAIQCPICLDEVKAAQTTTCGHIFCLSCITKYAVLGGCKSDISCPLCFGPISMVNLRSLHHRSVKCAKVGDQKHFYRLRRNKTSIFPSCSNAEDDTAPSVPVSKYGRCFPFAKFTLTADYLSSVRGMVKILEDYGEKLLQGGQEDCCEEELPFVFLAIEVLHERYRSWQERRKGTDGDHSPSSLESMEAVARVRASEAIQNRLKAQKESELWPVLVPNATGITTEVSTSEEKSDKKDGKEVWEQEVSESGGESADDGDHFHSYYQSCDGQNIFLHPVNIKCLLNHYENLGMAPKLLEAPILEIESFNVTEDTRKR